MPGAQIAFPKWEEVLSGLIEKYRLELDLPDSVFEELHDQLRSLSSRKSSFSFASKDRSDGLEEPELPMRFIDSLISEHSLDANQFLTLSTTDLNVLWVDDRISDILDVSASSLSPSGLIDWGVNPIIYHPMDAMHILRYAELKNLLCMVPGVTKDDHTHYFRLRFRLVHIENREKADEKRSIKLIEKKRSLVTCQTLRHGPVELYLNKWTVSNDSERYKHVSPSIEVVNDAERTKFLNSILYIYNCKHLGFSPKDVLVINYNNLYDGPEESRASLNRALRVHHDENCQFEVKPYTDSSYYLNKKLTSVLEKHSHQKAYRSSFYVRLNRLSKARRLGLTPLPRELRKIILSKAFVP